MSAPLMTPSKITAWLECPHYLTLRNQVDGGQREKPNPTYSSFARLLADKGLAHEQNCLKEFEQQGKSVYRVPLQETHESFKAWVDRVGNPLADDHDVVYQMPFVHDGIRGIADFVVRVVDPDSGTVSYEPVDAKLTRIDAKPGHVLQLCFYADAIDAVTSAKAERMHIWLGSGRLETLIVNDFRPYWRRLRTQLATALDSGPNASTTPKRCSHCAFCEFSTVCEDQWRSEDALIYVAGIRQTEIAALIQSDIPTLNQLATTAGPAAGVQADRLTRLISQAALQLTAREQPAAAPPFSIVEPSDDPTCGRGFEKLPEPNDGDVFLDFEGHPFWRAAAGLFFLFGLIERGPDGSWDYRKWWAHDTTAEAAAVVQLVNYLADRRGAHPGMHVYHYNHTERSALHKLAASHGVVETKLADLIDTGAFVDLYLVALNSVQVGTESYGLKYLERLTDYARSHDIDKGASAVVEYERFMNGGDAAVLAAIAAYNEDDVRATRALRDWLVAHRPTGMPWRQAVVEPEPGLPELDERVARLHAYGTGTDEYLLGDLLGYWLREWLAYVAPKMSKLQAEPVDLLDDPEAVAMLRSIGVVERLGKTGKPITPAMRFAFPSQVLDKFPRRGGKVILLAENDKRLYTGIHSLDREAGHLDLVWGEKLQEAHTQPRGVVADDWVDGTSKALALQAFADDALHHRERHRVTQALLTCDRPRFIGSAPAGDHFRDNLTEMKQWVTQLDESFVAIQGPPGTGKTYNGAHLIHTLIVAGARVGITATSHAAILNLMEKALSVLDEKGGGGLVNVARNAGTDTKRTPGVRHGDNDLCARPEFNLVAGTTWLFSSDQMKDSPVDVLVVDEAGQLALADALAASRSARNVILLGDPQQLPHVARALHPNGSGNSVLEHVLQDQVTISDDRGVFLSQTWRMHPDICSFISERFYEGRLSYHDNCKRQTTTAGTGLRWIAAAHNGNTTSSTEEAELVANQILELIGTPWVNFEGETHPLKQEDFMVVVPYNDHLHTVRGRLAQDGRIAEVPVGTVDKFQGREAAVVLFSMATSSGQDMTRGADFLFSPNRLNVAVSRARCLAYLVCTPELLNARARTVDDMRLIATLNAFVEYAE
ncbi:ATPase [Mycolicibacterium cyprinidarum]|uniref:ATPase n=1 Tax=Mycolicibacterium cyprinidarum TaxID=2860311 RepID=A0ABQ4V8U5_9MYCO|nr:ATPase [Mycolicibacterium sp. NGTWS0302]GJF14191.1 ATPase [Mycolicibacterium sp. NGTWSNA01]